MAKNFSALKSNQNWKGYFVSVQSLNVLFSNFSKK